MYFISLFSVHVECYFIIVALTETIFLATHSLDDSLLALLADYNFRMSEISSANTDLIKHCQFLEQEQLLMKVMSQPHHTCRFVEWWLLA